jgi:protoheme IX farnesyltransferase
MFDDRRWTVGHGAVARLRPEARSNPSPITSHQPPATRIWRLPAAWYRRLTLATAISTWFLIVLGGSVRVTDSGTGCGNSWPMCNGHLLPALEYHQLVEWNHRLFAALVGGLMIVTVGSTLLWYRRPRRLLFMALLAGVTYVGQAILGGITVLLDLDHTWVAAHMGNSMLLLGSLVLLATFARTDQSSTPAQDKTSRALRYLALATLIWTFAAMLTGSAVVGAEADVACPSWPQCSDTNILPITGDQWINFGHRLAVGLSDVLMLLLAAAVWRFRRDDRRLLRSVHVLALLYVSQVFLGAFTVWLDAPAALRGAHLALAAATWATLVMMTTFIWLGRSDTHIPQAPGGRRTRIFARQAELVPEPVRVYFSLIKPRVIPLLLVPTVASMLMAAAQHPTHRNLLELVLLTMLGGTLAAGGAHAINQYLDRDIDARMRRTKARPVVTGRVSPNRALTFGIVLSVLAFAQLSLTVNLVAALLAIAGNLFYVFVYTIWLKRTSIQNIVIGGAAGAVPPLVGWAAVTGDIGLPALLFFAIIFFWTPAHFWALALVRQEDYRAAGIPMRPVVKGETDTRRAILAYALILALVTLLPFATQSLSWLYLVSAAVLGLVFVIRAIELNRRASIARAWNLFKFSNTYLALLYLAMVLDRLLALGWIHVT